MKKVVGRDRMGRPIRRMDAYERVMRRVIAQGSCVVFTGARNRMGYGRLSAKGGEPSLAHRVVWEHHYGPIPNGLIVMHSCDNPPCVNIRHLALGTHADNAADKVQKGRASRLYGADNPRTKLTKLQVVDARNLASAGVSQKDIAQFYGVHPAYISRLVRGLRRQHKEEP